MMDRPALLEPAAAGLVAQVVKMKVDGRELSTGLRREGAAHPLRLMAGSADDGGLPNLPDVLQLLAEGPKDVLGRWVFLAGRIELRHVEDRGEASRHREQAGPTGLLRA